MAALANPLSTGVLTKNQFASQWELPAPSSAAMTGDQEFTFASRAGTYRVAVRNLTVPTAASPLPDWVKPTIAAFIGIQNLADNWDSYGGKAIDRDLINQSLFILGAIMRSNSPTPSVVPMGNGGLQIEWHRRQQDLEIVFVPDESPRFFYRNRAIAAVDEGSASETDKLIRFLRDLI